MPSLRKTRRAPALVVFAAFMMAVVGGTAPHAWALSATATTLAVTSGAGAVTPVGSGSVVTLTAAVVSGSAAVTPGQVKFCDATAAYCTDVHVLATAQLTSAGTASFKFVPGPGDHSYKAVFVGTNSYASSSSTDSALTVIGATPKIPTAANFTWTGTAADYTLAATVTASVDRSTLPFPTGALSFLDVNHGNAVLASPELGSGTSELSWLQSKIQPGSITTVVAVGDFDGDGKPDLVATVLANEYP